MISLVLPYPVSANKYWRSVTIRGRGNVMLRSKAANEYRDQVHALALTAGLREPILGLVGVTLVLHPREPVDAAKRIRKEGAHWHLNVKAMDVDNAIKVALDALAGIAYVDDEQIATLMIDRGMPVPGGALAVRVREVEPDEVFPPAPQMELIPEAVA